MMIKYLKAISNIALVGLMDSLSFQRTIPIIYNSQPIYSLIISVVGANLISFIGFVLIYNKGISPLIQFVSGGLGFNSILSDQVASTIYHSNWLVPICALCYISSMAWYQELADLIYKQAKGLDKNASITKTIANGLYGFLLWFIAFLQVQLLSAGLPALLIAIATQMTTSTSASSTVYLLHLAALLSQLAGLLMNSCMYGWYSFDPFWIASDVDPDQRLGIIEHHWAYFIGFGLPYILLFKLLPFFAAYGLFMALFPFCIMLGSVSDYKQPYEAEEAKPLPLAIFRPARVWALWLVKQVDAHSGIQQLVQRTRGRKKTD